GSDLDAATKAKLDRGARIVELFKQQQYQPKSLPVMVISLYAMQKGYFDDVAVDRIKECQGKLEEYLDTRKAPLLEKLANEKALDNVEADIKSALDDFKASWK
ncbi:MAG TPA: F0F1 ATP synthase subunit alpha, partial [Verrucomicrobiales bacterium]|nr:F0F1 ATP synthase subunit alpha [Verrucomicrobiales bacterium]